MLYGQAWEAFRADQILRGNSDKTLQYYFCCKRSFDRYYCTLPYSDLSEFSAADFRGWVLFLRENSLSSVSVVTYFTGIRAFFRWCYAQGYMTADITAGIKKPKSCAPMIDILTPEEISLLYAACRSDRDRFIIALMLNCGLRLSEVCKLRRSDLRHDYIIVHGKGGKDRFVPCYLSDVLREYPFCGQTLFSVTPNAVKLLFARLKERTGIDRLHAHLLRHTFATRFILSGGDSMILQQILGHTSIEVTQRYVHLANAYRIACGEYKKALAQSSARTFGGSSGARTPDTLIKSQVLYQLS